MRSFDLTPLHSSTIGFDRIFSLLNDRSDASTTYPPYNIEKTGDNTYRISLAVAGFEDSELSIESRENALTIRGAKKNVDEQSRGQFLFRGIAARTFERRFQLADYVSVGEAVLANGLLHVDLVREVPEAAKPKLIPISAGKTREMNVSQKAQPEAIAA